jgi:hypothetical protein
MVGKILAFNLLGLYHGVRGACLAAEKLEDRLLEDRLYE